ncbi:MAG: hypothetical protein WC222_01625 [Parachlamydiales bacterium]|jgi:hypothetical protein
MPFDHTIAGIQAIVFAREDTIQSPIEMSTVERLAFLSLGLSAVLVGAQVIERVDLRRHLAPVREYSLAFIEHILSKIGEKRRRSFVERHVANWASDLEKYVQIQAGLPKSSQDCSLMSASFMGMRVKMKMIKPAVTANLKVIFDEYMQEGPILELGAGIQQSGSISYLAKTGPKNYRSRFIYSDLVVPAKEGKGKQSLPYIQVDATQLAKSVGKDSQYNIVALCVVDAISRRDLPKFVEGLNHSLRVRGRVVIISDILFDEGPLLEKHSEGGKLAFPYQEGDELGIKTLPFNLLKERAHSLSAAFFQFIVSLEALSPKDRFKYLIGSSVENQDLFSILNTICPLESYEKIQHRTSFMIDLWDAFKTHKEFKVLSNGYYEKSVVDWGIIASKVGTKSVNFASADLRTADLFQYKVVPEIGRGKFALKSVMYVFAAEKIM